MDHASAVHQDQPSHWGDDRESQLLGVSIFLIIATCLATALRIWAQRSIEKQWEADNVISVFTAVSLPVRIEGDYHDDRLVDFLTMRYSRSQ